MERRTGATGARPVPMKLFAAWEVDRTPSNCIPRLCTLRVTRLRAVAPLAGDAVTLAARMHGSKRTLRSNDIAVPPPGQDVELDLCFSLQYPHFVKRDGNRLQIMLQRRKKYKNRTILGYKTLAEGVIRMDQVLQRSLDAELELLGVGGGKGGGGGVGGGTALARLTITGLASAPVDHDTKNNNLLVSAERGYSDEEEEAEFSSVEDADDVIVPRRPRRSTPYDKTDLSYTKLARRGCVAGYGRPEAAERDSDSEPEGAVDKRKPGRKMAQRNLKQKFAALLRRFRVPEELAERGAARDPRHPHTDIDQLFQELESLSCGEDSGPDQMDTISIGSTPKPSLRPFFSSSRSLAAGGAEHAHHPPVARHRSETATPRSPPAHAAGDRRTTSGETDGGEERGSEGNSDGEAANDAPPSGASLSSSPPREKEEKRSRLFGGGGGGAPARKKTSLSVETRPLSQHDLAQSPTTLEPRRSVLEQTARVFGDESCPPPETLALVWAPAAPLVAPALAALLAPTLVAHAPGDARPFLHALYTRLAAAGGGRRAARVVVCGGDALVAGVLRAHADLAARRAHDAPAPRFYIVPTGSCCLARQLAAADATYAALFAGDAWSALCAAEPAAHTHAELSARVARYLSGASGATHVPVGEAMVACRERLADDDSCQIFVPFLSEVRVGCAEGGASTELDEGGSPPARPSPPATPALPPVADAPPAQPPLAPAAARHADPLELQLDYWLADCAGGEGGGGGGKVSVKAGFRALQVTRSSPQHLQLSTVTKEKKQKIMRLGKKKERGCETEAGRASTVDGVVRLICSAKSSHTHPLKVYIDGVEWGGVKFFQLSAQWQTHVKTFPVAAHTADN